MVWTHPRQLRGGDKERGEGESPIELRRAATLTVLAARAAAAIGPRGDRRRAADIDGETAKCDFESVQISRHHRRFQDRTRTLIRIPVWKTKSVNKYFDQNFLKVYRTGQNIVLLLHIYVLYRSSFASYIYYILVYGCVCSEILSYFEQRPKSGEFVPFKIVKNW